MVKLPIKMQTAKRIRRKRRRNEPDRTPGKTFSGKYGGGIQKDSAGPGSFEPYNFITKRFQNKIYYNNYLQK